MKEVNINQRNQTTGSVGGVDFSEIKGQRWEYVLAFSFFFGFTNFDLGAFNDAVSVEFEYGDYFAPSSVSENSKIYSSLSSAISSFTPSSSKLPYFCSILEGSNRELDRATNVSSTGGEPPGGLHSSEMKVF